MARRAGEWDEVAIGEFTHDTSLQAIKIVTERVAGEGRRGMPVLDLFRTHAPGEGWSLPPGNLQRSVVTHYGDDVTGQPYGEVRANNVYRFTKKRRHAIRPALKEALDAQYGRAVP